MNNTNTINGLFHIPDEGSFLKKLILNNPTIYNPDIVDAFKTLQDLYPDLRLVHKENYFSLLLPTHSPGLSLEAMLITTIDNDQKLFSIYHRLHFDKQVYPQGPDVIEADAFLQLSAVLVNAPLNNRTEALASLLNYQVQEALEIEITMLTLADGDTRTVQENILPFINNTIARHMLACRLDDIEYIRPANQEELGPLIATYCDLPMLNVAEGIENLEDFRADLIRCEETFIPDFASSTVCLMFLLLEKKTSAAMLENGGLNIIKTFFRDKKVLYNLHDIKGDGQLLGNFQQLGDISKES